LPKYAGIPIKSTYSVEELEKIRKNHHLSSCQAVKDSIKTNAELPLGLSLCKKYTDFIALLCKYHRKLDLKYLKDTSIAGDPLRLHLLGAFLRLGDELDADYRRVDMEVLNIIDIPTESKFYWWSHHYVQSISIVQGHIKLFFWFPEEYKNNNIVEVFKNKRKESLREQFLEVYDIFENYGVRLYRDIEIEDTNYSSSGSLKPVPPDLLEYIKTTITKTSSNYKELSIKTGITWEIDGVLYSDNEKVVEALAKIPQLMNKYKYKEAVKIIEDTRLLIMSPKDKMIFSGIAGNCYFQLCDFDKAKSYCIDQLKLSEREDLRNIYLLDTLFSRSASLSNMGIFYQIQGNLREALEHYQQALEIDRKIGNKQGEASTLTNMGNVYQIQGKFKEALEHYQQALEIDRKIGNEEKEVNQLCNIGVVYKNQGKLKEALVQYQQALEIDRKIGNKQGEASALGNMGLVYQIQGKLKEALEYYQQALEIDRKIGNKQGEASDLGNMGIVYDIQGKPKEALEHYQQALEIDRKIGNKQGEAGHLCNIGNVYQIQGKLKEAFKHYQQALEIHRKIGNKVGIASDLCNMGIVYKIQGNLKEALEHYQQALEIDRKIGNKQGEASTLGNMGIVYQIQVNPEKALRKFKEALEIFNTLESSGNIEKINKKIKIVQEEIKE
jgi:tetratricopeptide (TPR) repeat protein